MTAVAPVMAADLGIGARWIGQQISLIYFGGMVVSAFSGVVVAFFGTCTAILIKAAFFGVGLALISGRHGADHLGSGGRPLWQFKDACADRRLVHCADLDRPRPLQAATFVLRGFVASGWNGVMRAGIAQGAPAGHVGSTADAALVDTFIGVIIGLSIFAVLYSQIGTYAACFDLATLVGLTGSALAARRHRA